MITDETGRDFLYDAWNRIVQVNESAHYAYDALGRRIQEGSKRLLYSDKWQVFEERTGETVTFSYAWSPVYVDAMIARDRIDIPTRYYVLSDANYNVVAITHTNGEVVERYSFDPYGRFDFLDTGFGPKMMTEYSWVYFHQGGRWDSATGMFSFRNRDYSPTLMRWNRMDPIGFRGGDPNLLRYEGNEPTIRRDPSGLKCEMARSLMSAPAPAKPGVSIDPICGRAERDFQIDPFQTAGFVVCYQGEWIPCVSSYVKDILIPIPGGEAVAKCALAHERIHIDQAEHFKVPCWGTDYFVLNYSDFYPFNPPPKNAPITDPRISWLECPAYQAGLDCLVKEIEKCGGKGTECAIRIQKEIDGIINVMSTMGCNGVRSPKVPDWRPRAR